MHISYDDITSRIAEPPVWWLEGVPRYKAFKPRDLNVYAHEVALMRVECQMCFKTFKVGYYTPNAAGRELLYRDDPPSHASDHEQDCGGDSMGATEMRVLEFWRKTPFDPTTDPPTFPYWIRVPDREVTFAKPMLPD